MSTNNTLIMNGLSNVLATSTGRINKIYVGETQVWGETTRDVNMKVQAPYIGGYSITAPNPDFMYSVQSDYIGQYQLTISNES